MKNLYFKPKCGGGVISLSIKNKKAFTLVELIIVVTILSILATIWFISFSQYWMNARDTVREVDFKTIIKGLELYKWLNGEYPTPDEATEVENGWLNKEKFQWLIEWKIWVEMSKKLKMWVIPKDPQTKKEYPYIVTEDRQNYIIRIEKENWEELSVWWIPTSCEKVKELWLFKWNWLYPIFFKTRWPIEVFCHKDFKQDFYQFVLGWDMEKDEGGFIDTKNGSIVFSTEDNSTPNGSKSIKIWPGWRQEIITKNFTYVDLSKDYVLKSKIKYLRNWQKIKLGWWYVWFIPYDKNFLRIEPGMVKIIEWSETKVSRNISKWDKVLYFECNDVLYNLLKNNVWFETRIAYNVDDSGEYKDIPNKNISAPLSDRSTPNSINNKYIRENFLKKLSATECSLTTFRNFPASAKWTKIRFHYDWGRMNYAQMVRTYKEWEWLDFVWNIKWNSNIKYVTKENWEKIIRPGTKFIKVWFWGNAWHWIVNWKYNAIDEYSTTYIDDVSFEAQ